MPLDWRRDGADWPNRGASRFVAIRGARLHVQRAGAGARILLLHGAGGATHSWRDLLPLLAAEAAVLAPDLPGQGFSDGTPGRFALPLMAEDLAALLQVEDFAPDLVVGHSAGGAVALQMVLSGRLAPRAVIGLNAALAPFRGMAGVLFPQIARAMALNPLSAYLLARTLAAPGAVEALIAGTGSRIDGRGLALYRRLLTRVSHLDATLAMMARWQLEPLVAGLPQVGVPVVLYAGERDRAVPPSSAAALVGRMPHGRLERVPEGGHLMHEEMPALFAALILAALREGPAAAAPTGSVS